MFTPRILGFLLFTVLCSSAIANTEIRNFEANEEPEISIPQTSKWPRLASGRNEDVWGLELAPESARDINCQTSEDLIWDPQSCLQEMWIILDLDHDSWRTYSKFTLRISWSASSPAKFLVQIHSAESMVTQLTGSQHNQTTMDSNIPSKKSTRRKYAHIRVIDETGGTSILSPSQLPQHVDFRVILEPLIMGILPASVQTTVLAIVLVACLSALLVPWIIRYLEKTAHLARQDILGVKRE